MKIHALDGFALRVLAAALGFAVLQAPAGEKTVVPPLSGHPDGESVVTELLPGVEGDKWDVEISLDFVNTGTNACEVALCDHEKFDPLFSCFAFGVDCGRVFARNWSLRSLETDETELPLGRVSINIQAAVSSDGEVLSCSTDGGEVVQIALGRAAIHHWRSFKTTSRGCAEQPEVRTKRKSAGFAVRIVAAGTGATAGEDAESSR